MAQQAELRAFLGIAGIYFLRMLGLFMLIPILSVAGMSLEGATPWLVGVAVGIYGLVQAFLQIPFGLCSDRFGRKPMVVFGLSLFVLGSVVSGFSQNIFMLIFGRVLQGAGAVASVLMAWLSDLSTPDSRSFKMAIVGSSIGAAFLFAMVLGPYLAAFLGVKWLFFVVAGMAVFAIFLAVFIVPSPDGQSEVNASEQQFSLNPLIDYAAAIFLLHALIMGFFMLVPLLLHEQGYGFGVQARIFLGIVFSSLFVALFMIYIAEKRRFFSVYYLSWLFLFLGPMIICFFHSYVGVIIGSIFFFIGFNFFEATLPSQVSKFYSSNRGRAMGWFSSSQFLGTFAGSVFVGLLLEWNHNIQMSFLGLVVLAFFFLFFVSRISGHVKRSYNHTS